MLRFSHRCDQKHNILYYEMSHTLFSSLDVQQTHLLLICQNVCPQGVVTKGGTIIVPLTSCLTGLDQSVLQIKRKIVSCHTANSKPVKQEVNSTVILPPLVFPTLRHSLMFISKKRSLALERSTLAKQGSEDSKEQTRQLFCPGLSDKKKLDYKKYGFLTYGICIKLVCLFQLVCLSKPMKGNYNKTDTSLQRKLPIFCRLRVRNVLQ